MYNVKMGQKMAILGTLPNKDIYQVKYDIYFGKKYPKKKPSVPKKSLMVNAIDSYSYGIHDDNSIPMKKLIIKNNQWVETNYFVIMPLNSLLLIKKLKN